MLSNHSYLCKHITNILNSFSLTQVVKEPTHFTSEGSSSLINPRRACAARVTVVVSCVFVCLSAHAILAVRAIKSITKDTIVLSVRFAVILKWRFS